MLNTAVVAPMPSISVTRIVRVKSRVASEAAESVADILKNSFDVEAWPLLVRFFLGFLHSPKCDDRLPARLLRRHSGGDVRFGLLFEVKLQLLVYFTMRLGS
jgi:hypothetical protein